MKKLYNIITLLFAIGALSNIASAQIVNIPDAAFKAALVGNSAINTNADTEIQVSEAAAYTGKISVNSAGIADMTGIEAFTALDSLSCFFNSISSLNISPCTALRYLNCDYNQLTSLNLSSNTALTGLNCTNNPLTSLDVSANTALTSLGCGGNKITSLDVSNNTALTALICFYDSIGTLDVSMLTALVYFDCSYNKLTSLNMRNGNNINLMSGFGFNAKHNANLFCIQVDDSAYMYANWPNGKDSVATYNPSCPLGVENISSLYSSLNIFPNPATDICTITANTEMRNARVEISNVLGEKIYSDSFTGFTKQVQLTAPAGIYFVKVRSEAGDKVLKLVKE